MADTGAIRAGRAFVELFVNQTRLQAGLKLAEQRLQSFGSRAQSFGSQIFGAGVGAALPIAHAVKTFMDFDDAMRTVQGVTSSTGAEFEKLTSQAKLLGATTSWSASEVANAMLSLGRGGFSTSEIEKSISNVMDLARVSGADIGVSTDIAINALRSFNLPAEEMIRVVDVLATTANKSAQTVEDIGNALSYIGPVAKEAGLSIEDVAKVLGSLANFGIKGSMAGTSVKNIISRLADQKVRKQYEDLGVAVVDAEGNLRNISEVLRDLGDATSNLPNADRLAIFSKLFGLEAMSSGAKLTAASFQEMIDAIDNSAGKAHDIAETMDSGIGGAWRSLCSVFEAMEIAVGESLKTPIQNLFQQFKFLCSVVQETIVQHKDFFGTIVQGASGLAALGAALIGAGAASKIAAGALTAVRLGLGSILQIALSTFKMIASACMFVLSPASLVIGAVAGIGFGIWSLYKYTDVIPTIFQKASQFATVCGKKISGFIESFFPLGDVIEWLKGRFDALREFVGSTMKAMSNYIKDGNMTDAANLLWSSLKLVWVEGCGALSTVWNYLCLDVQTVWSKSINFLAGIFVTSFSNVQIFWTKFVNFLSDVWNGLCDFIASIWDTTIKGVEIALSKAYAFLKGMSDSESEKLIKDIEDKYQSKSDKREADRKDRKAEHDAKVNQLENDKSGMQKILDDDLNQKLGQFENEFNQNAAANNDRISAAKAEYQEAMNSAHNEMSIGLGGEKGVGGNTDTDAEKGNNTGIISGTLGDKLMADMKEFLYRDGEIIKSGLPGRKNQTFPPKINNHPEEFDMDWSNWYESIDGWDDRGLGDFGNLDDLIPAMNNAHPSIDKTMSMSGSGKRGSFNGYEMQGTDNLSWMKRNSEDQLQNIKDIKEMMENSGVYI